MVVSMVCCFWTKYVIPLLSNAFNKSSAGKQVNTEFKIAGNFLRKSHFFDFGKCLKKY
jgi:hypothetical protein